MIPLYSFPQFPPQSEKVVNTNGSLVQMFYFMLQALFNRTGGNSGIPFQVANDLTATGNSQATALGLTKDYNEVLGGAANTGVQLKSLQPGQQMWVFNGTGVSINVYPDDDGEIDTKGVNAAYALATGKTQIYTCTATFADGGHQYRSLQLG